MKQEKEREEREPLRKERDRKSDAPAAERGRCFGRGHGEAAFGSVNMEGIG